MNCFRAKLQTLLGGLPADPILASGFEPEFYFAGIIHRAGSGYLARSNNECKLVHIEQLDATNAERPARRVG